MYFGASEETDNKVPAQLLNRLLCCFAGRWRVTSNLLLCPRLWRFSCMSRWDGLRECCKEKKKWTDYIQVKTFIFITNTFFFSKIAEANAFGLLTVLKCLLSDPRLLLQPRLFSKLRSESLNKKKNQVGIYDQNDSMSGYKAFCNTQIVYYWKCNLASW